VHAMQYEITLPDDYDMEIIHRRVATRGHLTDAFTGLGLKAYLIRTRGIDGSPVNQYAPFYLWSDTAGMRRFLWGGGGFGGIVNDFGRPVVQHWSGVGCLAGRARTEPPTSATKHLKRLSDGDPTDLVEHELSELVRLAERATVHTTALAIDPRHWELVRFTLWTATPEQEAATRYRVLHLSCPQLDQLR